VRVQSKLRLAASEDVDVLLGLCEQFYRHFEYRFEPLSHRAMIERFVSDSNLGSMWLLESSDDEGAKAIGYVALTYGFSFEFGGRDAFVDELFVAPTFRGTGVGTAALKELQQRATSLGLVGIHLQTEHYNVDARKLYESLGFSDLKRSIQTWLVRS
jgi:GNAT superfamily N-acetyltransferase